ncbi:MAG: hypothetical protein K2K63_01785 [Acetatifactor sp.]|nr:hypothetical protein [Acetatifactor sp.]
MEQENKLEIPSIVYQGDDKKLQERVRKFKAGTFRIVLFTIVGFIMGHYSYTYVGENFMPMKAVLAIPYKLNEALYVSILGTDAMVGGTEEYCIFGFFTEFFPHSYLATFLAETVSTVLIGGAVYGALAYFTGDRKVFTMQRFVKFAGCWCIAILLCVVMAYGVNTKAVADNEALKGIPVVRLYDREGKSDSGENVVIESLLEECIYGGLEQDDLQRDYEGEVYFRITFSLLRTTVCRINFREGYLVAEKGTTYRIPEEYAQIMKGYAEGHILTDTTEGPDALERPDTTEEPGVEMHEKTEEKTRGEVMP